MMEEWDFTMLGMVGGIALAFQLFVYFWEKWQDTMWPGISTPIALKQTLLEWAAYMLLFVILSIIVRGALYLACSYC